MKIVELNEMELMTIDGGRIRDRSSSHGHGGNSRSNRSNSRGSSRSGGHRRDCSWSNRDFSREVVKGGVTGAVGGAIGGSFAGGVGYAFDRGACKLGW